MSKEAFIDALKKGASYGYAFQSHLLCEDKVLTHYEAKELIKKEYPEYFSDFKSPVTDESKI